MAQSLEERRSINGENQPEVAKRALVKKAYVSPRFLEYGSIAKLTQSGGRTTSDGIFSMRMACL